VHFTQLVTELSQTTKISYREFVKVMIKLSGLTYTNKKPITRLEKLLRTMNKSKNLERMDATGRVEGRYHHHNHYYHYYNHRYYQYYYRNHYHSVIVIIVIVIIVITEGGCSSRLFVSTTLVDDIEDTLEIDIEV
jgi:hypothetical protein